jgi:hypothetical protein
VAGPFPAFPMTKREKPWERGWEDQIVETFLYGSEILGYEENQILMRNDQLLFYKLSDLLVQSNINT